MGDNSFYFSKDYASDFWAWAKIYEPLQNHKITYPTDHKLDALQHHIITNQNSALAFFFSLHFHYKTYLMQDVIIKNKNLKYLYNFAKFIDGADIKSIQELLIVSKNLHWIVKFGCDVDKADKKRIEKIILHTGTQTHAHTWIKNNKDANIAKLKHIILNAKNCRPSFVFELAKKLNSPKDIRKAEKLIIASGSLLYIRLFAATIKYANIKKLEKAILKSKNIREIKKFAKTVKGSNISKFLLVLD